MHKHIMMENYKELKRGQRVTVLGNTRDSGYLVVKIAGTYSLPLDHIVKPIEDVKVDLHYHECKVKDLTAILLKES